MFYTHCPECKTISKRETVNTLLPICGHVRAIDGQVIYSAYCCVRSTPYVAGPAFIDLRVAPGLLSPNAIKATKA